MKEVFLMEPDETLETLPGRGISVLQKRNGYRFSIDAVILAGFVRLSEEARVLELGSGSGVVSFILAGRHRELRLDGIDIQDDMVEMSNRSARLNKIDDRVRFEGADIRQLPNHYKSESYDVVYFNPPYGRRGTGKINLQGQKATARHELNGGIDEFIQAAAFLLHRKGRVFIIYPAKRAVTLLASLKQSGIEPKTMRCVHSRSDLPATLVLVEGIKGAGEEIKIPAPLIVYESVKVYSKEMEKLFETGLLMSDRSGSGPLEP